MHASSTRDVKLDRPGTMMWATLSLATGSNRYSRHFAGDATQAAAVGKPLRRSRHQAWTASRTAQA
jgi:hypothetical protein